jgi:hypothetical protein
VVVLTGSDETLENAYLMRLAGRFSRRIRGYAQSPRHSRDRLSGRAAQARPRGRISGPDPLDALDRLGPEWEKPVRELHRSGWR